MLRPAPEDIERFVRNWVAQHIHMQPSAANVPMEVDSLAAQLTGDARVLGISGRDMYATIGDIDAYLTECYLQTEAV